MPTKDETAMKLARAHFDIEPGISRIFRVRDGREEDGDDSLSKPIKLLEINVDTAPVGVMPLQFGPSAGIPFSSIIIEVTPGEFDDLRSATLSLPGNWRIAEELPRPAHLQGVG